MEQILNLRGAALSKFKSIESLSKALGWKRSKTSRIINGIQEPTGSEIALLAEVLDLPQDAFVDIFFASLSTKWTNYNDTNEVS